MVCDPVAAAAAPPSWIVISRFARDVRAAVSSLSFPAALGVGRHERGRGGGVLKPRGRTPRLPLVHKRELPGKNEWGNPGVVVVHEEGSGGKVVVVWGLRSRWRQVFREKPLQKRAGEPRGIHFQPELLSSLR